MLKFQWEKLDRLLVDGLEDLIWAHWEEVEVDRETIPLSVDWGHLKAIEAAGGYRVCAARHNGRLVGYSSFFLNRHTRSKGTIMAVSDVLYLALERRQGWAGVRLVRDAEALLKAAGAVRVTYGINITARVGARGATVGDLLGHLGYRKTGEIYAKLL